MKEEQQLKRETQAPPPQPPTPSLHRCTQKPINTLKWRVWWNKPKDRKRRYKSINCLMLVFSYRLKLPSLFLHVYSCFIKWNITTLFLWFLSVFYLEWSEILKRYFKRQDQDYQLWIFDCSSECMWRLHVCTSTTLKYSLMADLYVCAGSRAVMQLFRGSTRIWRTRCTGR